MAADTKPRQGSRFPSKAHRGCDPGILSLAKLCLAQVQVGSVQGEQHYRLLLDLVPGAPAPLRVLLHAEHVPVVVIPGIQRSTSQRGWNAAMEPSGCSHRPRTAPAPTGGTGVGQLNTAAAPAARHGGAGLGHGLQLPAQGSHKASSLPRASRVQQAQPHRLHVPRGFQLFEQSLKPWENRVGLKALLRLKAKAGPFPGLGAGAAGVGCAAHTELSSSSSTWGWREELQEWLEASCCPSSKSHPSQRHKGILGQRQGWQRAAGGAPTC